MTRRYGSTWAICGLLALAGLLHAGEKVKGFTAVDEASAGPDFKVQGEYLGEVAGADGAKQKLGAQVIACGKGEFHSAFYLGGLPGEGWDGKTKIEKVPAKQGNITPDAKTDGDKTVIEQVYKGTISGDTLTGETDKGEKFTLKKVLRQSPTLGAKPPEGAIVLFDGTNTDQWDKKDWMDARKFLKMGVNSKRTFTDFTLHLELVTSFMPESRGQGRSNSGVFLPKNHEIQVLDSFGLAGDPNECGGVYSIKGTSPHMCFPPLSWQTYDIEYEAAKYDADGKTKTKNAVVTLKHNGVLVHDKYEIPRATNGPKNTEIPPAAIQLQDHGGDPVFFRNIWIVEKK
ncbi:MAG TPA: DUF1080 domain-containing protein [Planctomycetota bacterium]|jgi:hypothetical protein